MNQILEVLKQPELVFLVCVLLSQVLYSLMARITKYK